MRHIITTILATALATGSTTAVVAGPGLFGPPGPPGYPMHPHSAPQGSWVAPLVVGTVLGAVVASQPRTVVVEPTVPVPVPVAQRPADSGPGTLYRRVEIYVPECGCYRVFDVPIN